MSDKTIDNLSEYILFSSIFFFMEYYWEKKSYDGRWRNPKKRLLSHTPLPMIRKKEWGPLNDEKVTLLFDEVEALRLKYIEGMYITEACRCMWISKSLFANIINKGLSKLISWVSYGKDIEIQGEIASFSEPVL